MGGRLRVGVAAAGRWGVAFAWGSLPLGGGGSPSRGGRCRWEVGGRLRVGVAAAGRWGVAFAWGSLPLGRVVARLSGTAAAGRWGVAFAWGSLRLGGGGSPSRGGRCRWEVGGRLRVGVAAAGACCGQVVGDGCGWEVGGRLRVGVAAAGRWGVAFAWGSLPLGGGGSPSRGGRCRWGVLWPGCRGRLRPEQGSAESSGRGAAGGLSGGVAALEGPSAERVGQVAGDGCGLSRVCCRRRAGLRARSRALTASCRLLSAGCRPQLAGAGAAGVRARTGGREGHPTASCRRVGAGFPVRRGEGGVGSRFGARPFRCFIPCGFDFGEVGLEEGADGGGHAPVPFLGDSLEA